MCSWCRDSITIRLSCIAQVSMMNVYYALQRLYPLASLLIFARNIYIQCGDSGADILFISQAVIIIHPTFFPRRLSSRIDEYYFRARIARAAYSVTRGQHAL